MRNVWTTGLALMLAAMTLGGCNSGKAKEENQLLMSENQQLREQLADRNAALDAAQLELRDKDQQVATLRRDLDSSRATPVSSTPFDNIPGVQGSVGGGKITATVESDVLFASGSADLKAQAKRSLDAVANVLNSNYSGRTIEIVGHTDTDPIRKSGFKTNHHLGFERAYAVWDYLRSRGVSADRMSLMSWGPHQPRGSKSQSRRVEIAVLMN